MRTTNARIKATLDSGQIIAYPTEAVWGLGCDFRNQPAVMRLLQLKQRAVDKGLILICADFCYAEALLQPLPASLHAQLRTYWPGHYTLLLPDPLQQVPGWIKGAYTTFALRISAHPVIRQINTVWPQPIVSTSANISSHPPVTTTEELVAVFGDQVMVVPGALGQETRPSRIIDLASGKQVR